MQPNEILDVVTWVFARKGRVPTTDMLKFIVKEMKAEFTLHYFFLAIEEVRMAFYNGIRGNYGEVYDISVEALCGWLDAYCVSDEHRKYIEAHSPRRKAIQQTATVTEDEKRCRDRQAAMTIISSKFTSFRRREMMGLFNDRAYDILVQYKLFAPSKDIRRSAYNDAKKVVEMQKKMKHGFALQDYLKTIATPTNYHQKLVAIAKESLLKEFFAEHAKTQESAELFLTQIKRIYDGNE